MKYDFESIPDRSGTGSTKWDNHKVTDPAYVPLSTADMEFPTAPPIRQALSDLAENRILGYAGPTPAYFEAVQGWMKRRHNFDAAKEWIITTPGVVDALGILVEAATKPGEGVIILTPAYYPFELAVMAKARKVVHSTLIDNNGHYEIDYADLEAKARKRNVTALMFCNPHNPTGRVFTREELTELSQFIIKHDLICVCDQAFEDTAFPGHEMVTMASLPGMWERTVTVCSCSKGMALSGYRVGYIFADDVIMDTMYATAVNIQGAANTMVQMAMIPAYEDTSFIQDYVAEQDFRRRYAYEKFNAVPGVSMPLMESGFYGWVNVSRLGDSSEITAYLAEEAKTLVNDGKFYGDQGAGHLRIIYGVFADRQKSLDGIDRLCAALAKRAAQLGITE